MQGSRSFLGKLGFTLGLMGLSLLAACGAQNAEAAFASDFKCDQVSSEETMAVGRYRVSGCGHEVTYQCVGPYQQVCAIQMVDAGRSSPRESSEGSDPAPRRRTKRVVSDVQVDSSGNDAVMVLELVLDGKALLRVTATPDKHADLVQFKVVRQESSEDVDECNLDFMLNGQVIKTPKAVATRKGDILSHRVQVGRDLIADFGTSEKIALRICEERWGLNREQVQKVRDFMDRFQEEMAWKAPPREGATGGLLAPSGGWPAWSANAKAPNSFEGNTLDARALFKKLGPSVFKLEASRGEGTAQGSAVAITTTELVTNCHVVQGALKLVLKQEKKEWPARLVRADPATDRCVLSANSLMMQPVAGVRTYDSLEVGEPVYTLGSPVGLELTLSNGIVSGRREEKKWRYVQTTAPISPGSSGGGLFDARGNLVGITTLVLVGREHMNQALNFAIPADAFWQP
jgi:hypothetical protein